MSKLSKDLQIIHIIQKRISIIIKIIKIIMNDYMKIPIDNMSIFRYIKWKKYKDKSHLR